MTTDDIKNWVVIVVDDEPDNVGVAEFVLSHFGAQVHVAEDGIRGLELLQAGIRPTFILLDLSMPKMTGWEMLRIVRSNPETASLPVIALTAHAMKEDREHALEAGFDSYISKPFRVDTLLNDLMTCMTRIKQDAMIKEG